MNAQQNTQKKGELIVVGTGINVISQTTISAKSYIENADIVFIAIAGATGEQWVRSLNANVVSLASLYDEGKSRIETYQQMVDSMVDAVHQGKKVCAAFYGHPGVFVSPTHKAIKILREQGYKATMHPGVSAEDCLVADLGIDPGKTGCQAIEATQFLFYKHILDPSCLLILWQISLSGDHTLRSLDVERCQPGLKVLMERLMEYYPADHEVILYEASTHALAGPKIERMALNTLADAKPSLIATLVVPSRGLPDYDEQTLAKLGLTVADIKASLNISQSSE